MAGGDATVEPSGRAEGSAGTAAADHGGTGVDHDDSPRDYVVIYLKGAAMGTADAVPGVSGGTIALIAGIYERLIAAITDFDTDLLRTALRLHRREGRDALRRQVAALDIGFLLALGLGIATALVTVSRVLEVALEEYTALTFAFFFGLIAASAVVLYGEVSVSTPRRAAAAVVGFVLAFVLTGEVTAILPNSPVVILFAGAIAVSAMILPGISGSFLLLVLGQYEYVVDSLSDFTDALIARDFASSVADATVLVTFAAGAVVGLLTVSRVIEYALEHYRAATLTFLVSLMVGALRLPVERVLEATGAFTPATSAGLLVAAAVGAGSVLALDHYTEAIL